MKPEPTILGEHGEGYCPTCRFIVPLDEKGKLARHERGRSIRPGTSVGWTPVYCKGEYRRPGQAPGYSRKSMFRSDVKLGWCPACLRRFPLLPEGTLEPHDSSPWIPTMCKGSCKPPHAKR